VNQVVPKIPVGRVPVQTLGRREPTVVGDGVPFQAAPLSAERMQHLVSGLVPARIEGGPPIRRDVSWSPPTCLGRPTCEEAALTAPIEGFGNPPRVPITIALAEAGFARRSQSAGDAMRVVEASSTLMEVKR
jgi:hypothetical protein